MTGRTPMLSPASPHDLAAELAGEANSKKGGPRWGILPYQRHQLDDTVWWMRKGASNPAYSEYKAAVFPDLPLAEPGETLVGVALEKGYGPAFEAAALTRKDKNQVMKSTWAWHRVFPSIRAGALIEPCRKLEAAGLRPLVYVSGLDRSLFEVRSGSKLAKVAGAPLPSVKDWGSLASAIDPTVQNEWKWLNLYVGALFRAVKTGGSWTAARLWPELLVPLLEGV